MEVRRSFLDLLDTARQMTEERLRQSPDFGPYLSVRRQLAFLHGAVLSDRALTDEEVESFTFGRYAAREFEPTDPDYADVLHRVYYRVRRGDGVRRDP